MDFSAMEALLREFSYPHMKGCGYGLGVRMLLSGAANGGAAGAYTLIDPENGLLMFYGQHMLNNLEEYVQPRLKNVLYAAID